MTITGGGVPTNHHHYLQQSSYASPPTTTGQHGAVRPPSRNSNSSNKSNNSNGSLSERMRSRKDEINELRGKVDSILAKLVKQSSDDVTKLRSKMGTINHQQKQQQEPISPPTRKADPVDLTNVRSPVSIAPGEVSNNLNHVNNVHNVVNVVERRGEADASTTTSAVTEQIGNLTRRSTDRRTQLENYRRGLREQKELINGRASSSQQELVNDRGKITLPPRFTPASQNAWKSYATNNAGTEENRAGGAIITSEISTEQRGLHRNASLEPDGSFDNNQRINRNHQDLQDRQDHILASLRLRQDPPATFNNDYVVTRPDAPSKDANRFPYRDELTTYTKGPTSPETSFHYAPSSNLGKNFQSRQQLRASAAARLQQSQEKFQARSPQQSGRLQPTSPEGRDLMQGAVSPLTQDGHQISSPPMLERVHISSPAGTRGKDKSRFLSPEGGKFNFTSAPSRHDIIHTGSSPSPRDRVQVLSSPSERDRFRVMQADNEFEIAPSRGDDMYTIGRSRTGSSRTGSRTVSAAGSADPEALHPQGTSEEPMQNRAANHDKSSPSREQLLQALIALSPDGKIASPDGNATASTEALTTVSSDAISVEEVKHQRIKDPYGDKGSYSGILIKKRPHGQGNMRYDDGRVYDGQWHFGRWHGVGRATFANGDVYEGSYEMDQRHGHGMYQWSDGRVYTGQFFKDQRQGRGTYTWPDGAVYQGEFKSGHRHGQGIYQFADGSVYTGEWKDGKYHGVGECRWADRRIYRGEWECGRANGYGVEIRPDGTVRHDGQWRKDRPLRDRSK